LARYPPFIGFLSHCRLSLIIANFPSSIIKIKNKAMTTTSSSADGGDTAQKITPFLWFDGRVEEAINFYTSVFKNTEVVSMSRLPAEVPDRKGNVIMATIRLNGLELMLLDGGPMFKFTEAISLFVHCETQEEVDKLWDVLTADGGEPGPCGWLKDKFGLSWQIVPNALGKLMGDPNRAKAANVQKAMMQMKKIDIAGLEAAYDKE
jgi:predicted 3-demethylubiquinone-9 3-methyltransferase (glyoxalase superfamily)